MNVLRGWMARALAAFALGRKLDIRAEILGKLADCADNGMGVGVAAISRSLLASGRNYKPDEIWQSLGHLERKGLIESALIPARKGGLADKRCTF